MGSVMILSPGENGWILVLLSGWSPETRTLPVWGNIPLWWKYRLMQSTKTLFIQLFRSRFLLPGIQKGVPDSARIGAFAKNVTFSQSGLWLGGVQQHSNL